MATLIPAVELIYRELATPKPSQPKPAPIPAPKKTITRADVDDVIQRRRTASPEELQELLSTKDINLTEGERSQICVDLTVAMAQRSRNINGRRDDPNAKFIAQVLGFVETPHGLIPRSFITDVLREGAANISRCRLHRPPLCDCWSAQRAILWEARAHGEKSPEGWAAVRLFDALEHLETASRPERQAIPAQNTGHPHGYFSDIPARFQGNSSTDN